MKMTRLLIAISLILFSQNVFAQQNQDQNNITAALQEITIGQGEVTKAEYDKFWRSIGVSNKEDKKRAIISIQKNFLLMQSYNKEMWSCAETAWLTGSVPKCEQGKVKIAEIKTEMMKLKQDQLAKNLEDAFSNILKAAASRKGMQMPGMTQSLPLTIESIRASKANTEKMLSRIEKVLRIEF